MKRSIAGLLLLSIYFGSVAQFGAVNAQAIRKMMEQRAKDDGSGLKFRLSEGVEGAEARTKPTPVPSEALGDPGELLKRVPAIRSDPSDEAEFRKRLGTLPPPKTGTRIPVKFPSGDDRGTPKVDTSGQKLDVIRYSPEGEIKLAPDLNVTFSQPMVAVTSQEEAAKYVPVEFSPQVEGRWRWLGTKTLMFDTDKRFPMATRFTVRVPAGTRSATGLSLAKDVTWTFTTPPPKVEQMFPNGGITRRDQIMFMSFDQAIDPSAVIKTISVSSGGKRIAVRLATDEEIASDGTIAYYKSVAQPGRWLAFRAVNSNGSTENALPGASPIGVVVEKGTPSAEGPLVTTETHSFSFQTYSPLEFRRGYCGWRDNKDCSPLDSWALEFNNSLDSGSFSPELVTISPAIEGAKIYPSGNTIQISGIKKGNTTYTITVAGTLRDTFGQQLGKTATATIKVGRAPMSLGSQGGNFAVLDPNAKPAYSVYSVNHSELRVKIYSVVPTDFYVFSQYAARLNYDDGRRPAIPGRLVSDEVIKVASKPDEMVETRIDLAKALNGGLGNVILDIEPVARRNDYDRTRIFTWLQSTQIGLDAFVDNAELVGFATDLKTGRPLAGAEMSIYPDDGKPEGSAASAEQPGVLERLSNWIAGLVRGPNSGDVDILEPDGSRAAAETVEPAQSNRTGANGILRFKLPERASGKGQNMLIAKLGRDTAFLPENSEYLWNETGSWYRRNVSDDLRWFAFDDRKLYKPKEEVAIKGYIRKVTGGKTGDIQPLDAPLTYNWTARDPRNNEIAKGTVTTNPFGAFDLKFKLPDNANLGYARVAFIAEGSTVESYSHQFQIQEFRRPEFEVSARIETEGPHIVGSSVLASVEAKYYSGGGLANAETNWTVSAVQTNYTPPNRDDFTFGTWVPWWRSYDGGYGGSGRGRNIGGYYGGYNGGTSQSFKGVTDAGGKHVLKIDLDSATPPRPYSVTAAASVQDVNRQTWSSTASMLVHPASLYVGIRSPRTFVQKGEKIRIESIATDIDGNLASGRDIEIRAILKDWQFDKGAWAEKTIDEQFCTVRSGEKPSECAFTAKQGGRYTISATVMDDRERFNESEITIWVPGGNQQPKRNIEQEEVQIIPSKKDYAPGDIAELLVISPFTPAEGVLTLRREGLVKTERFTIRDSSVTLRVPIEAGYLPNIFAQVDLVGAAPRQTDSGETDPKLGTRPAFASGTLDLPISIASRQLKVSAEAADKTLSPGGKTTVSVNVRDFRGEPVANSEVALVIVDESVLALTKYSIGDPSGAFYAIRQPGVSDHKLRKDVLLVNPNDIVMGQGGGADLKRSVEALPMAARSMSQLVTVDGASASENTFALDAAGETPIELRKNFDALALWSPTVLTNGNGEASIELKLPDNLTRYRITAVSVDSGRRFGKGESFITARQPLMVRPSAPRFLNFGDRADVPVVIQNQTDADMSVDVAIRASNALILGEILHSGKPRESSSAGRRIVVKANDRAEVRFPVSTVKAGTARFQFVASSGKFSDAAEIELPVWTPATTEAFATYGTTDKNGAIIQPVAAPPDVFPQFGGLEVTTSSTQLQELTDAYISLYRYPYECSEQISSRMISTAALRDVLTAFKAKDMPSADELNKRFARDVEILASRQRSDGSFGLWTREKERYSYPFLTVHVAHALALAKAKGYKVPDGMLDRTKPYLKDIEKHFDDWYKNSPEVRWTISAYALYVRALTGDKDIGKTKKLLAEATIEKMPFEALGWTLSVLADDKGSENERTAILRFLMNRTTETASTANFVTNYGDGAWLIMYSNRRADGVLLEALIKADRSSDLIPKLVRGLLDNRVKGAWSNTQENVFILLALDKYFNAFESVTPDMVARIWLGNAYAGEQIFKGRSVDSNELTIPMEYLAEQGGSANLLIDRQGAGRLYYRIGMKYAPRNLKLDAADYGFTVLRRYEAVDDKDDVKQDADGTWTIRSGARVRVRLTMVAQARRYHVALVDQLPAGLEILNPGLAVTESIPADTGAGVTPVAAFSSRSFGGSWWWSRYWFEHQNFRDERAEAFASLLWEGVYNYSYVTRATTPGRFIVPPAKAEEMYHPEAFGRTATDLVVVE